VENILVAEDGGRPDAEGQAGQALRRLRLARQWSQEEAARRMRAYGYDFHQTTIAKIEAAQRPLRVRELADFAALYGVEVNELIYPPVGSLNDIDQEIAELEARRAHLQEEIGLNRELLDRARFEMAVAQKQHQACAMKEAALEGRLAALRDEREKLIRWEVAKGSPDQLVPDDEQPSAAMTLTHLANLGEMHLGAMDPPDLGTLANLAIADRAAQWAQVVTFVVRMTLGESQAEELAPAAAPRRNSTAHPRPDDIAPELADYWDSVAWRIDKLREWAAGAVD
jgi:transcriptional regulator with XRE-family HTH domain